jgi:hypothetical protein
VDEIRKPARFFSKRSKKSSEDFILLGDFNIVRPEHETMKALEDEKFTIPPNLRSKPSNIAKTKHYDQIAFKTVDKRLELGESGVFEIFNSVFQDSRSSEYKAFMPEDRINGKTAAELAKYFKNWRTFQLSDHHLMWTEIVTDFTEHYLTSLKES